MTENKIINTVGQTTLRQTAALLKHCSLFIGNDSGPMHIAAAMKTSVIEISCHPRSGDTCHPNSPTRFSPWGTESIVLQPEQHKKPCQRGCEMDYPHCILNVHIDSVINACNKLIKK